MVHLKESVGFLFNNRWLVFVAAMWIQTCAGIGYLFGSISPTIKKSLNYNQRQIARLGVAKDLGDSVGFLAGTLCEILPLWAALLVGAIQNFIGYGWVWLIVTSRAPSLPLWAMCILIFIGTNGETYFNTAALVSCVQNFPKSRGPVVGILKGFAGLGGAILTQIYAVIHSPDHASLIFMIAVGPAMVIIALMFIIRPVGGHKQVRPSDGLNFSFIYSICLLLASYLMGVMLVEDLIDLSHIVITIFTAILFILLAIPIVIPISSSFFQDPREPVEEGLLSESKKQETSKSELGDGHEIIFSEVEDEKPKEVDALPASERQRRIAQLQAKLAQAAAKGAVRIKRRRGPHRGEDFTLMQALIKADFWLMFFSLLFGSGSGLTVIDNLGQISQSLGYDNTHVFVSMISIWNFLGRIGGGYFSEIIVRDYAYPRHAAMAVAQVIMAIGHFFFAMGWPGAMHIGTLLVGLGYGAHWAIVPAAASELFGLRNFGALYNFLTLANPAGSMVFSGVIASSIYDMEAAKQAHEYRGTESNLASVLSSFLSVDEPLKCEGAICFFLTSMIMSGLCIIAVVLSMILVHRTKIVYAHLYGKSRG
ncbi:protein NUCLEAR FUSION DEFECTIVE 4 isoform X1 [Nicotiana tabacum]|uniref:Protein NUCLEAR FUSION DEFECTIVE 4 n=3 Tax=Nicotiana tabacum TaxID=4097 RepID=A0A1S3YAN7_TOBAC|nr:protein NUCLEAR FUSION DEFECTIVE 4-like isoform X1 [Nicotiana tomentosiformis]XP_016449078.1 PREDICTED: protein NUCLEAR FUSION DEFECTIVE 4 [Nicotiana tabacum]